MPLSICTLKLLAFCRFKDELLLKIQKIKYSMFFKVTQRIGNVSQVITFLPQSFLVIIQQVMLLQNSLPLFNKRLRQLQQKKY